MSHVIMRHTDHHRAGSNVSIGHYAIIRITRSTPEQTLATVEKVLHGVKEGIPPRDFSFCFHTIDPEFYELEAKIMRGELRRYSEFARSAINSGLAYAKIAELASKYREEYLSGQKVTE